MTEKEMLAVAAEKGFFAAFVPTKDIVVDYKFRKFCEDNVCGKYGANYSCPPDCGTVEEVHKKLLSKDTALVLQMICEADWKNRDELFSARNALNMAVLAVADKMAEKGKKVIPLGYSGCPLCSPCRRTQNLPCAFPDRKISCVSAYCVDVAKLTQQCGFEFEWSDTKMYLLGMVLFDK